MEQNSSKQRESWIDVLKGIGIILVVIGHTSLENCLVDWIYTFHMPMFFMLSGYLWNVFSERQMKFREFVVRRIKTILWPYVLFRIVLIVYWIVVESRFRELDLGPIWFLIVLFVVEITSFVVFNNRKNDFKFNVIIFALAVVVMLLLKANLQDNAFLAWGLRIVNGFAWYVAGQSFGVISNEMREFSNIKKCMFISLLFVITIMVCATNGNVSMWSNDFGNINLYIIGNIAGTLFVALICKWFLRRNDVMEFLGQNTIVIMATHEPIKRVILKMTEIICKNFNISITIDKLQKSIVTSLVVVFVILMMEVLVMWFFRKIKENSPVVVKETLLAFVR